MICPECGKRMRWENGVYFCKRCDLEISEDEIPEGYNDYEEPSEPECCSACGGDYPKCKPGCPIFDD